MKKLTSGEEALKFSSFLIPEGKEIGAKRIDFVTDQPEALTEKTKMKRSFDIMEEEACLPERKLNRRCGACRAVRARGI